MSRSQPIPRFTSLLAPLTVALAVAAAPMVCAAQESPEATFQRADANGDGKVSKEEAAKATAIAARFAELDKNKDGMLSLEEFLAGFKGK
jgi:hypothetical protein